MRLDFFLSFEKKHKKDPAATGSRKDVNIMRRANGSGTVYKLSGKRRKPWLARITTGWTDEGKQQYKNIGTFPTKKEAQAALDKYIYVPDTKKEMTFKEAFDGWKELTKAAKGTVIGYTSGFKKLSRIYDVNMNDFTLDLMQDAVSTPPMTYNTAVIIKKVLAVAIDYAYSHDCCQLNRKELLKYVVLPEKVRVNERRIFTDDEIQACVDQKAYGAICLLFTGLRRDEFLSLKPEDIHLDEGWIHVSKSKTVAGIRDVPLPDRLIPFFRKYMESPLFGKTRTIFTNDWNNTPCLKNHVRHECRHTYITKLTEAGVDQRIVKALAGHAGTITETVYTHFSIDELRGVVNRVFNKYLPVNFDEEGEAQYEVDA